MYNNGMKAVSPLLAALLAAASMALGQGISNRPIEIRSVEISVAPLPAPRVFLDDQGEERSANEVYIVELRGELGEPRAIPVEIYIGDYKVEEYGGIENGIYFKVYDATLFDRLENQPFAYGFQGQRVKTLDIRFTPSKLKPFVRLDSPKPKPPKK